MENALAVCAGLSRRAKAPVGVNLPGPNFLSNTIIRILSAVFRSEATPLHTPQDARRKRHPSLLYMQYEKRL